MAGIGFKINKLIRSDIAAEKIGGVAASILCSSGPWLCTILGISCISYLKRGITGSVFEIHAFRIIVNYTYAASLVIFGTLELITTRYLADALYLNQQEVIPSLYTRTVLSLLLFTTFIGCVFYSLTGIPWQLSVASTALLSSVTLVWCAMIFLSTCKEYLHIVISFVVGMIVSVGATHLLGTVFHYGVFGEVVGFTLGQALIGVSLGYRIFREFGFGIPVRDFVSRSLPRYPLVFVGFSYSLGVWIDKVIFWLVPQTSTQVAPLFYMSPGYETAMFLSYVFVVPTLAYFLVQMETSFYVVYRNYFTLVDLRAALGPIENARLGIWEVLLKNLTGLALFQGTVTLLGFILSPWLFEWLGVGFEYLDAFRFGLLGSTFYTLALVVNITILYFDLPAVAAKNFTLFLLLNTVLSFVCSQTAARWYGSGYAAAAIVVAIKSFWDLRKAVSDLHFLVFMRQPYAQPRRARPRFA